MSNILDKLDDIDFKILQLISKGANSYSDISDKMEVSRSTVYRRIRQLEEKDILKNRLVAIPNFQKLGFSAMAVGITVDIEDIEKAIKYLKNDSRFKVVLRTYGEHDIFAFFLTADPKDKTTPIKIQKIQKKMKNKNIRIESMDTLEVIEWEKIDLTINSKRTK